jgi:6-pyruvoyltetrahydropterin/6-carboxytetrahydropterin synthase
MPAWGADVGDVGPSGPVSWPMEVFREFTFDAAHALSGLPSGHKCARVHGHTYRLTVGVEGSLDPVIGWIVDFAHMKAVVGRVLDKIDHRVLNEVPGLEQPTTELIAVWIWRELITDLPGLSRVTLYENANSGVTYRGEPVAWRESGQSKGDGSGFAEGEEPAAGTGA